MRDKSAQRLARKQRLNPSMALDLIKEVCPMPAPDPFGISYEETADGRPRVLAEVWPSSGLFAGNPRHRSARAKRILRNLNWGGWCCLECGDHVPLYRRADAVYCREACRKKAARHRKAGGS